MEGVEIVIRPIHLERLAYILIIIALAVLLIIKWGGSGCVVDDEKLQENLSSEASQANSSLLEAITTDVLCSNNVKDQDETDVDCGGIICSPCPDGKLCMVDSDCENSYCHMGIRCQTPTCDDGVQNQGETAVDCGGPCTETKGAYFYDGACHKQPKPEYSGRVDLTILKVETSVNEVSGYARIDKITFKVDNGKEENIVLSAFIYAKDKYGKAYYVHPVTADEITLTNSIIEIPLLSTGESYTSEVDIVRTLTATPPTDAYRVLIELRDDRGALVRDATWTNN